MIRVEVLEGEIPQHYISKMLPGARAEYNKDPAVSEWVLRNSVRIIGLSRHGIPCAVVGVIRMSFLGGGNRLWFVPCEGLKLYRLEVVRALRKLIEEHKQHYVGMTAAISVDKYDAQKFAKFFGFEPTGAVLDEVKKYELYRLGA